MCCSCGAVRTSGPLLPKPVGRGPASASSRSSCALHSSVSSSQSTSGAAIGRGASSIAICLSDVPQRRASRIPARRDMRGLVRAPLHVTHRRSRRHLHTCELTHCAQSPERLIYPASRTALRLERSPNAIFDCPSDFACAPRRICLSGTEQWVEGTNRLNPTLGAT